MGYIRHREANGKTRGAGMLRRSLAQVAVLGLLSGGALAALSVSATATPLPSNCSTSDSHGDATALHDHQKSIEICKSGPESAVAGTDITYTLEMTVQHDSEWDATAANNHGVDLSVTDSLPTGLTLGSASGSGWDCTASTDTVVNCTLAGFDDDSAVPDITVVAHLASSFTDESVENCAVMSSTSSDWSDSAVVPMHDDKGLETGDACWTTDVTRSSDISIEKTGPASLIVPGNAVYTITATNNGPSDSDPVTFSDTLPAGTTLVSAVGDAWDCTASTATVLGCTTLDGLVVGDSASITVTLAVSVDQQGVTLENCASVTGGDTSNVTENDESCATIDGENITVEAESVTEAPVAIQAQPTFTG